MTQRYRTDQVLDEYDRPVPGSRIYVNDATGVQASLTSDGTSPLPQPITTDQFGVYSYYVVEGVYREDIWYGGKLRYRQMVAAGPVGAEIIENAAIAADAAAVAQAASADFVAVAGAATQSIATEAANAEAAIIAALAGTSLSSATLAASNRAVLAALDHTLGLPAYLMEAGREGMFVWVGSNLSAMVSADPNQGVYVAPSAAPTGAAGAWHRAFTGAISVRWCGAVGDGSTNDAAAIQAAINLSLALRNTGTYFGYSHGGPRVYVPASTSFYYCGSTTIEIFHSIIFEGDGGFGPSGDTSVLKWDNGVTGLRIHSGISTGATGFTTDRGYGGAGTIIRNLMFVGGFTTTESESHGIHARTKFRLEKMFVTGFSGDGVYANSFSYDGIHDDNVNGSSIYDLFVYGCRNGIYLNYNDANAIQIIAPQMFANRQYGIFCINGYGCSIFGGNSATNGVTPYSIHTAAYNNGHVFGVLPGRETQCSTNSPPSTAVSDSNWFYMYDTGAATTAVPQWVTAQTWRSGGPIRIDGGSTNGVITGHEVESDQMPMLLTTGSKIVVLGGLMPHPPIDAAGNLYGGYISSDAAASYFKSVQVLFDRSGSLGSPTTRFDVGYFYDINAKQGIQSIGPTNGVGYAAGAGAAVTQLTSKSTTTPAINNVCGKITMHNAALAAGAKVSFAVSNSIVVATDTIIVSVASGGTANAYRASVTAVGSGTFTVTVENITGGSLSEAPVINFAVIRSVSS
jgi:hypothetical protein